MTIVVIKVKTLLASSIPFGTLLLTNFLTVDAGPKVKRALGMRLKTSVFKSGKYDSNTRKKSPFSKISGYA